MCRERLQGGGGGIIMAYFEDVLEYGNLEMEKVLFMFDYTPIIFVCKDVGDKRYLCQCTDMIVGYSWMITRIPYNVLISMMQNEISVLEAFKRSRNPIVIAERMQDGRMGYHKVNFTDLAEEELPDPDEKLDNPYLHDYIDFLQKQRTGKERDKRITKLCEMSEIFFPIEEYSIKAELNSLNYMMEIRNNTFNMTDMEKGFRCRRKGNELGIKTFYIMENTSRTKNIYSNSGKSLKKTITV